MTSPSEHYLTPSHLAAAITRYSFVENDGSDAPIDGFVGKETLTAYSSDHLFNFTLHDGTTYQQGQCL